MAEPNRLVPLIESYVDPSISPAQQVGSLDAIASLLKNNVLSIEAVVRELGMYLTTTDSVIRSRGILLLGELLSYLVSKPLDSAIIHSLIAFFRDRLADWKALHGALVGCLALLKRKSNAGIVSNSDATAVAQSYLQNLQVQSLGHQDRKLCFELLECLLHCYPDALTGLGDDLVYGICEAIDGEKDPQCLLLTFHIIEVLARLFPDSHGAVASFSGELFEILGCYFPIHYTHPTKDDVDVKRDDLSKALMLAFSSTPHFEPFAIPLLLDKLSSSLPLAKVDSLKYLADCTVKYGADRMEKYGETLWSSLKSIIFALPLEPISFLRSESEDMRFQENEIANEALLLLQKLLQNGSLLTSLILGDEDINKVINSTSSFKSYNDIPLQSKQNLYAVGCILNISAKASNVTCNSIFESLFHRLMDMLGLPISNSPQVYSKHNCEVNFGVLYLCIELIAACRDLVVSSVEPTSTYDSTYITCEDLLQKFSPSLTEVFCSVLVTSKSDGVNDADIYGGVKGLQILATFPKGFSLMPESIYENILMTLTTIISCDFSNTTLWRESLKALVKIGLFVGSRHEPEKTVRYMAIVVEKIVSLLFLNSSQIPLPLILETICEIGATGLNVRPRVVQGLEEAILTCLSNVYVHGNSESAEIVVQLLGCFSRKVLPWFQDTGDSSNVPLCFGINIWNLVENTMGLKENLQDLLDVTLMAMKLTVGVCSEENQSLILKRSFHVLASGDSFSLKESTSLINSVDYKGLQVTASSESLSHRDIWLISLFASVIIAIRPQTCIPYFRQILHLFMKALLKGHIPSAQALGSMVNKLHANTDEADCTLEEAIDMIFSSKFWICHDGGLLLDDQNEMGIMELHLNGDNYGLLEIHAIIRLAWIGKGLLMRGHEKFKDITIFFLRLLVLYGEVGGRKLDSLEINVEENKLCSIMRSLGDVFHILLSDSEDCLNKKFHAIIKPLYKQRFFSTMMPTLLSTIVKCQSSLTRPMLYRAFGHVVSNSPLLAILTEAKKLIPVLLDCLLMLRKDVLDKDMIYSLLLVFSGILMDKNGKEAITENVHIIVDGLTSLISYPHMMLVRETAIQCLLAMSELPHTRIYPMRSQVLRAVCKALDDPKRAVRQEAVRCRQAWASIATRSLHF